MDDVMLMTSTSLTGNAADGITAVPRPDFILFKRRCWINFEILLHVIKLMHLIWVTISWKSTMWHRVLITLKLICNISSSKRESFPTKARSPAGNLADVKVRSFKWFRWMRKIACDCRRNPFLFTNDCRLLWWIGQIQILNLFIKPTLPKCNITPLAKEWSIGASFLATSEGTLCPVRKAEYTF